MSPSIRHSRARGRVRLAGLIVGAGALAICAPFAGAHTDADATGSAADDFVPAVDPTFKAGGVTVDEKLGAAVPRDATFRTADGATVTLGGVLSGQGGELPTILTFNYSDCPMLCSVQLNGLTATLPKLAVPGAAPAVAGTADNAKRDVAFRIGSQFRIVTIDLEPNEPLAKLAAMRDRYIDRVVAGLPADAQTAAQRAAIRAGWTFLAAAAPGDGAAIRRVADAVGFRYIYVPERAEWAHPAALIFLSSAGSVTRYVYGIDYDPVVMRESIFKAGVSEAATAVGFMNRCYHFDPNLNSHARAGVLALRAGAGAFTLLLGGVGVFFARRRRFHARHSLPSGPGASRS